MDNGNNNLLSQKEIDELLSLNNETHQSEAEAYVLTNEEKDILGEVGNISMGLASTTLSALLNQRVEITSPRIFIMDEETFWLSFEPPLMSIKVDYTKGLKGFNLWVTRLEDALCMADLMMGGEGKSTAAEITEMEISAASEAINQMIGTAATSLSDLIKRTIDISPPQIKLITGEKPEPLAVEGSLVVVSFRLRVGDVIDTDIMQVMSVATAKDEAQLLLGGMEQSEPAVELLSLTEEEIDALGEVGNISTGSASTTLSTLLSQRVQITSPRVSIMSEAELLSAFKTPFMTVKVLYTNGIVGFNLWIITLQDALIVADLMMGGEGKPETTEITDLEISAASEAMNQMIGTSATSLSTMFNRIINIAPPETKLFQEGDIHEGIFDDDPLVVVSFRLTVGNIIDTEIMQVMSVPTAKDEARLLLGSMVDVEPVRDTKPAEVQEQVQTAPEPEEVSLSDCENEAVPEPQKYESAGFDWAREQFSAPAPDLSWEKINLILDVPLKVTVVLGRTKKPIKDVLGFIPGAIVELNSLVEEPVEILVNGTLVARGEVVVVNENFGVRLTNIITPQERIESLLAK